MQTVSLILKKKERKKETYLLICYLREKTNDILHYENTSIQIYIYI